MIDNILGFILLSSIALILFKVSRYKIPQKDYTQYPVIEADVHGTHDNRWIVQFTDEYGNKVLGRNDRIIFSKFNPPQNCIKRGTKELVYYWPFDIPNSKYTSCGIPLKYHIHFCNPVYEQQNEIDVKHLLKKIKIAGWILFVCSLCVLFFG